MNSADSSATEAKEARSTPPAPADGRRGVFSTVTSNAVVAVTLVGAAAYVVTRLSHVTFYNRFGVDPSEVGLSYTETLSRAAAGLVVLTLAAVILGLIQWGLGWLMTDKDEEGSHRGGLMKWTGVLAAAYVLLGILLVYLPFKYRDQAVEVLHGNSMRPGFWGRALTNPLGVRAERVRVTWIDDANPPYDFGTRNIVYLGRSDGIAVFYDPKWHRTVRVPDTGIVVRRRDYVLAGLGE